MQSIPCDVVLLPTPALAGMAFRASQSLELFDTKFTLKDGEFYPHASLYMLQLTSDDLARAQQLLADIAQTTAIIQLAATGYGQAEGYIDVDYAKTDTVIQLQQRVVAALNPIRDGMRAKDQARLTSETGLVLENLKQYGYRSVGELFRPHITLTRFELSQTVIDNPQEILGDADAFNGAFVKLGLFEMGDNGTCVRKISEFEFLR